MPPALARVTIALCNCVSSRAVALHSLTYKGTSTYNTLGKILHIPQLPITGLSFRSSKRMNHVNCTRLWQSKDALASRNDITIQLQDRLPTPLRNMNDPDEYDVLLRDPPSSADPPVWILPFKLLGLLHRSKMSGRLKRPWLHKSHEAGWKRVA